MLCKTKMLNGYKLQALDGEIGQVQEFYFDDQYWAIRYLVANTGDWLLGRRVLISPHAIVAVSSAESRITIHLTRKRIEDSPALYTDKPVSRQFEESYYKYYGWPRYWNGVSTWGLHPFIRRVNAQGHEPLTTGAQYEKTAWDPHLQSTRDVSGNHVQAEDGEIGHIVDFVIDDETWAIRYLIIDTTNWLPGKKVLVSPRWIERISWSESKVFIGLSREAIKQSPEYSEADLLTRDYEDKLYRHYNRHGYWVDELVEARRQ